MHRCMCARIYTGIPSSYSCGLFVALSRGHTRLTRLQLQSKRTLSCLLQKHRLRYTIKLPSPVRGLASLLSLFLLLFLLVISYLRFLLARSSAIPSFPSGGFPVSLSCYRCRCYRGTLHENTTEKNAEAIQSQPLTICARLIFLLHLSSYYTFVKLLSFPSTQLRRAAFVNFYAFLMGNVIYYQRSRELCL